jgi:hypothetical protein
VLAAGCLHALESSVRPFRVLSASVFIAVCTACSGEREPVDETATVEPIGWGCLDRAGELADDPLNPAPAPYCRIGVLNGLKLEGRPEPVAAVIDHGSECSTTTKGFAIDLAPGVAARFNRAFQLERDFVPLSESPACPSLASTGVVPALPGGATIAVEFLTVSTVSAPSAADETYVLPAAVEARLIEAGSGRVLWHDTCRTDTAELSAAASFPGSDNLRQVLTAEALRCADGFAAALGAPPPI